MVNQYPGFFGVHFVKVAMTQNAGEARAGERSWCGDFSFAEHVIAEAAAPGDQY